MQTHKEARHDYWREGRRKLAPYIRTEIIGIVAIAILTALLVVIQLLVQIL